MERKRNNNKKKSGVVYDNCVKASSIAMKQYA